MAAVGMTNSEASLLDELHAILGEDGVLSGTEKTQFFAIDLTEQLGEIPAAVTRPRSTGDVTRIVEVAARHGYAVNTRGGGVSYTRAHVPTSPRTVGVDMRGMNGILEINVRDRFVTLETGVTWFQLREALAPTGYRVPYLGTYSGRVATVGGGLSQNATGMGRGTLAEHVLGLEVVLGDGSVVQTGSSAVKNTSPFYRYNGPDFTGPFLCDSGAFGIKTKVTLLLEPVPTPAFACFAFDSYEDLVRAQVAFIEAGHTIKSFGFGTNFLRGMADKPLPPGREQWKIARRLLAQSPSKLRMLRMLWRAWAPRELDYLRDLHCAMYVIAESYGQADADRMIADITRIARDQKAKILPPTIGFGARFGPYPDLASMLFSEHGEVWFPVNGKFPPSQAVAATAAVQDFIDRNAELMKRHGIRVECNFLTHGYFCGLEPIFFWHRKSEHRERYRDGGEETRSISVPPVDETTTVVFELRAKLTSLFRDLGAMHVQWAKAYPYMASLGEAEGALVRDFKEVVDAGRTFNPGILGL